MTGFPTGGGSPRAADAEATAEALTQLLAAEAALARQVSRLERRLFVVEVWSGVVTFLAVAGAAMAAVGLQ